jgi:hypothetical protein
MHIRHVGEGGESRGLAGCREDGETALLERCYEGGADAGAAACYEDGFGHGVFSFFFLVLKLGCGIAVWELCAKRLMLHIYIYMYLEVIVHSVHARVPVQSCPRPDRCTF